MGTAEELAAIERELELVAAGEAPIEELRKMEGE
jgi:hypothetical protein